MPSEYKENSALVPTLRVGHFSELNCKQPFSPLLPGRDPLPKWVASSAACMTTASPRARGLLPSIVCPSIAISPCRYSVCDTSGRRGHEDGDRHLSRKGYQNFVGGAVGEKRTTCICCPPAHLSPTLVSSSILHGQVEQGDIVCHSGRGWRPLNSGQRD